MREEIEKWVWGGVCAGVMEGGALCDIGKCEEWGVGQYHHLCVCGEQNTISAHVKHDHTKMHFLEFFGSFLG